MYFNMFRVGCIIIFCLFLCNSVKCLEYSLNIGNSINVFANYGNLSQLVQIISAHLPDPNGPPPSASDTDGSGRHPRYWSVGSDTFSGGVHSGSRRSRSVGSASNVDISVFKNVPSTEIITHHDMTNTEIKVDICDDFESLLDTFFENFTIEGTDKPWKMLIGSWLYKDLLNEMFGMNYTQPDCCYVLLRMTKKHKNVTVGNLEGISVDESVNKAIEDLNITNLYEVRKFMKQYGTHYIDSYEYGNIIYQLFKYKANELEFLHKYVDNLTTGPDTSSNLQYYFTPYSVDKVGQLKIASGLQSAETWARKYLIDTVNLDSMPSILRLTSSNSHLLNKLNTKLDNRALIRLNLKILRPVFKDKDKAAKYAAAVERDFQLLEVST